MKPKVNTYFSGAGLMDLGLSLGGLEITNSFELDAVCCETQRRNFGHRVVQCDIAQKLVGSEDPCDVRVFTYPCTKYSSIADIHGTRTGDELYLHALRHMVVDPPEVFVAENVPGMRKFPVVMEAMTRLHGYFVTVFCPVETSDWLPQDRSRLIIFGSRRPFSWSHPRASRPVPLSAILEADPKPEYPDYINSRLDGAYRDRPIVSDPARGDIAPLCVAHYAKDLSTRLVVDRSWPRGVRPYTVREYARLQGVPDSFEFSGTSRDAYRMIGNGVPIPIGRWIAENILRYFAAGVPLVDRSPLLTLTSN